MSTLSEDLHVAAQLSANSFVLSAACVGTANLQSQAVTPAKLSANLARGYIPLSLGTARIISGGAIQNTTEGGVPDGNTAGPKLERVNGATDKALRLVWAATEVNELQFESISLPPDWDESMDVVVSLQVDKDTNSDASANIDVQVFFGKGDTECGGATASITETSGPTEKTVTISAANNVAHPSFMNIALIPSAHANDAIRLYAAHVEYNRKE